MSLRPGLVRHNRRANSRESDPPSTAVRCSVVLKGEPRVLPFQTGLLGGLFDTVVFGGGRYRCSRIELGHGTGKAGRGRFAFSQQSCFILAAHVGAI